MANLLALANEVLEHQFSPTQYGDYAKGKINQGQKYICAQTSFRELWSTEDATLVSGTDEYALPTDFNRVFEVLKSDGATFVRPYLTLAKLEQVPFYDLPLSNGTPTAYTILGDNIALHPCPDSTANIIRVVYYADPTEMTLDADEPVIPDQYEYLLVHYALKFCFERENDYTSAQYHWGQFEAGLMKCRGEVHNDTNDRSKPRRIGDESSAAVLNEGF